MGGHVIILESHYRSKLWIGNKFQSSAREINRNETRWDIQSLLSMWLQTPFEWNIPTPSKDTHFSLLLFYARPKLNDCIKCIKSETAGGMYVASPFKTRYKRWQKQKCVHRRNKEKLFLKNPSHQLKFRRLDLIEISQSNREACAWNLSIKVFPERKLLEPPACKWLQARSGQVPNTTKIKRQRRKRKSKHRPEKY